MDRNTPEQRNFNDGMKLLIDLYYSYESLPKSEWGSEIIINKIAKILYLTLPNFPINPRYFVQNTAFQYQGNKLINIDIDPEYVIPRFLKLMNFIFETIKDNASKINLMCEETEDDAPKWIKIINITYEVTNHSNREKKRSTLLSKKPISYRGKDHPNCEIIRPLKNNATNNEMSKYFSKMHSGTNVPPEYNEFYHVKFNLDPDESPDYISFISHAPETETDFGDVKVATPGFYGNESFRRVATYIIVKFFFLFKSFKRLKKCGYEDCGRIFFEKRRGTDFCPKRKCKQNFHLKHDKEEGRRACRDRNNQWLRNYLEPHPDFDIRFINPKTKKRFLTPPHPRHVQKEECMNCKQFQIGTYIKGGKCQILRNNNVIAFDGIRKYFSDKNKKFE